MAPILVGLLFLLGFPGLAAAALLTFGFTEALLPVPFAAALPAALRRVGAAAARPAQLGITVTLLLLLTGLIAVLGTALAVRLLLLLLTGLIAVLGTALTVRLLLLLLTILPVAVLAAGWPVLILILVGHRILHRV